MQSYDAIFISNLAAGDLGLDRQRLLESAVRDFGVGLVCVGGDQTYAAGGYRGTPLEATLPVNMELDSKKVLPSGAVVLVMHGMEFANGNQVARDVRPGRAGGARAPGRNGRRALGRHGALAVPAPEGGRQEEAGAGDRRHEPGRPRQFPGRADRWPMQALQKSTANLKHIIVFSDGDPGAPTAQLMQAIVGDRITVSTVLISGHSGRRTPWNGSPTQGKGRFYDVNSPDDLPQIFIKETAVILKSAIYEEPFQPQVRAASEVVRGIGAERVSEAARLRRHHAQAARRNALVDGQRRSAAGPLAIRPGPRGGLHLRRQSPMGAASGWTGASTASSGPRSAQWSMRRLENADFTTEVAVDKGEGLISVEALDEQGNYRNFLNLQAIVVSPKGERQTVRLEQTGPGHYEARFPTKEVGAYLLNLMDIKDGQVRGSQVIGASVNYSPEFNAPEPNLNLLRRIAETGGGKLLDPMIPARQSVPARPAEDLPAARPLGVAAQVRHHPVPAGCRRAAHPDWPRRVAAGHATSCAAGSSSGAARRARRRPRNPWPRCWRAASRSAPSRPVPPWNPGPSCSAPTGPPALPLPGEEASARPVRASAPRQPNRPNRPTEPAPSTASRLLEAKRRAQKREAVTRKRVAHRAGIMALS